MATSSVTTTVSPSPQTPAGTPLLAAVPATFERHGQAWDDEYEWVRQDAAALSAALAAENAYTEQRLAPVRSLAADMFDRLAPEVLRAEFNNPQQQDGWWFVPLMDEGAALPRLVRLPVNPGMPMPTEEQARNSPDAQTVLDLDAEYRRQRFTTVGAVQVSPCGRYVAWTTDETGQEQHRLRLRRLGESGDLCPPIDDVSATVVFSADGDVVLATRLINGRSAEVWRYSVDGLVTGAGGERILTEPDPRFRIRMERAISGAAVFITSTSRTTSRNYALLGRDAGRFVAVADLPEGSVASLSHLDDGDGMRLLVTLRTPAAPNRELRVADVPQPGDLPVRDVEAWPVLLPHSPEREIAEVLTMRGRVLVSVRESGTTGLLIGRPVGAESPAATPALWEFQSARIPAHNVRLAETPQWTATTVALRVHSYLRRPVDHLLDLATGTTASAEPDPRTSDRSASAHGETAPYTEDAHQVVSADGTLVPMTVLRPAGALPRSAPTLLVGYGAYGVSMLATYNPLYLELLRRGVVVAVAHVRGGGENGSTWHEAGRGAAKPRSFEDFIACRDHLVDLGWADPRRVAAHGGSAGGLLAAAAANLAPGKFAALMLEVPFVDPLTTLLDADMPLTVSDYTEFGDPAGDAAAFEVIRSYSPYHNVPYAPFPPTLASCATEDVRVNPIEALKWTARLRARATGGPFLLHVRDGGHYNGSGGVESVLRYQLTQFAWVLEMLGVGNLAAGNEVGL
jgi:oligopeptidase B